LTFIGVTQPANKQIGKLGVNPAMQPNTASAQPASQRPQEQIRQQLTQPQFVNS
jgi:hypothetical protein